MLASKAVGKRAPFTLGFWGGGCCAPPPPSCRGCACCASLGCGCRVGVWLALCVQAPEPSLHAGPAGPANSMATLTTLALWAQLDDGPCRAQPQHMCLLLLVCCCMFPVCAFASRLARVTMLEGSPSPPSWFGPSAGLLLASLAAGAGDFPGATPGLPT